jgi:hypothetical protein
MITRGQRVITGEKHKESDTIVLGTPLEYMNAALVSL